MQLTDKQKQILTKALIRYGQAEQALVVERSRVDELCTAIAGEGYVVNFGQGTDFELLTAEEATDDDAESDSSAS